MKPGTSNQQPATRNQEPETGKGKYPPVKKLPDSDRIEVVKDIFSTVTPRYDFLNHLLSLRRDVVWRYFAVRKMRFFQTFRFLDVATGTGDLAILAASRYSGIKVIGLDFVKAMLDFARPKVNRKDLSRRIEFLQGDALNLPFDRDSFDVAGIAFGIRNIPDRRRALREMIRVVVPGGQVMVLEMTMPRHKAVYGLYSLYLNRLLPRIARLFSKNPSAYLYLGDSIVNFPGPEAFARILEEAGLTGIESYPLTLGTTYLYIGIKP